MKRVSFLLIIVLLCVSTMGFAGGSQQGPSETAQPQDHWRQFQGAQINVLGYNVSTLEGVTAVLPQFEALTGIRVNIDTYAEAAGREKAGIELATGSGAYDVMYFIATDWVGWLESDWIEPLDRYLIDPRLTRAGEIDLEDFAKGPMTSMYWDDTLYGLPGFGATTAFFYRTDILEQQGVKPPDTVDEWIQASRKLHTNQVAANSLRGVAGPNLWPWLSLMYAMGGQIYVDYPNDMRPALNTPQVAAAMEAWRTLAGDFGIEGYATANFNEIVTAMQQGRAAMMHDGAPLAPRVLDPNESRVVGQVGFAQPPAGPAGRFAPHTAHGWLIPAAARQKDAAWLFIKWVTSEEVQFQMAMEARHLAVTRVAIYDRPEFRERYEYGPGFLDTYRNNVNSDHVYHPVNRAYAQVRQVLGQELARVTVGTKTGARAAQDAHNQINQIMIDAGFYTE